jgi:hypothetical protein
MAGLHRRGVLLRKPLIFNRVGIPGSGGPDWMRNDWEWIICATNGGKLPWSRNTACGHPPKWGPGGKMSNRLSDGSRVNQWGKNGSPRGMGNKDRNGKVERAVRPSHVWGEGGKMPCSGKGDVARTDAPIFGNPGGSGGTRHDGSKKPRYFNGKGHQGRRVVTRVREGMHAGQENAIYAPPVLANPGNVLKALVGGGVMGSRLCHLNEAPFPEALVRQLILPFCPPSGIVLDPFGGSGTTAAVAAQHGRRSISIDIRPSQIAIARRRLAECWPHPKLGSVP